MLYNEYKLHKSFYFVAFYLKYKNKKFIFPNNLPQKYIRTNRVLKIHDGEMDENACYSICFTYNGSISFSTASFMQILSGFTLLNNTGK